MERMRRKRGDPLNHNFPTQAKTSGENNYEEKVKGCGTITGFAS